MDTRRTPRAAAAATAVACSDCVTSAASFSDISTCSRRWSTPAGTSAGASSNGRSRPKLWPAGRLAGCRARPAPSSSGGSGQRYASSTAQSATASSCAILRPSCPASSPEPSSTSETSTASRVAIQPGTPSTPASRYASIASSAACVARLRASASPSSSVDSPPLEAAAALLRMPTFMLRSSKKGSQRRPWSTLSAALSG
mmetsp:Transcript_4408/g.11342  ORF Transcript_4408/g.11342 Transcript_4408/m.11342 type:complete len:200 (-) Transcript_4408:499-1098(-)